MLLMCEIFGQILIFVIRMLTWCVLGVDDRRSLRSRGMILYIGGSW